MAQTLTVTDGEVLDVGSTTVEMLTVETGGTLNVDPSASFSLTGSEATTIDNSGVINTNTGSDLQFARGVSNSGAINIDSGVSAAATDIVVTDDTTLTGGGTISLSGANPGITGNLAGLDLTVDGQTIQGQGALGRNVIDIINNGVIVANVSGETLTIDTAAGGLMNAGDIEATNSGTLAIAGTIVNNAGGSITAQADSTVLLDNATSINGGAVSSVGTGEVRTDVSSTVSLNDVANSGSLVVANNSDLEIEGTITNSGSITFDSTTIDANEIGGSIVIDPTGGVGVDLVNNGTLSASNGGTLDSVHNLVSNGTITVDDGTILANALGIGVGGVVEGDGVIDVDTGDIMVSGLLTPGDSLTAGSLELQDGLVLDSAATVDFGLFDLAQFDTILIAGEAALDGTLDVSLLDGFVASATDVFDILLVDDLTGGFANVANGGTLFTSDGGGSFTVSLTANSVQLSNFEATVIPEPGTLTFTLALVGGIFIRRRRKC